MMYLELVMRDGIENDKIAEIKKLLSIVYVETKYEALDDTAVFIKAAIKSLNVNNYSVADATQPGMVIQFPARKSV